MVVQSPACAAMARGPIVRGRFGSMGSDSSRPRFPALRGATVNGISPAVNPGLDGGRPSIEPQGGSTPTPTWNELLANAHGQHSSMDPMGSNAHAN